jgi:hypothetical protein
MRRVTLPQAGKEKTMSFDDRLRGRARELEDESRLKRESEARVRNERDTQYKVERDKLVSRCNIEETMRSVAKFLVERYGPPPAYLKPLEIRDNGPTITFEANGGGGTGLRRVTASITSNRISINGVDIPADQWNAKSFEDAAINAATG